MLSSSMAPASKDAIRSSARRSQSASVLDLERMAALVAFTARSMLTAHPKPFGAAIFNTKTGELLLRTVNAVAQEFDPSSHAEVRAIRKATKQLKRISLAGHTLYSTCEPCP